MTPNLGRAGSVYVFAVQGRRLKINDTGRLALLQRRQKIIECCNDKDRLVVLGQASVAQAPGDLRRQ